MSVTEYLLAEPGPDGWVETDRQDRQGQGFYIKRYADGADGGPFAVTIIHPAGFDNPAHFHTEAQFQVLFEGAVSFPTHDLTPVAVHYSDKNTPYGPFQVGDGFMLGVLRQIGGAAQIYMSDREGRRLRDPHGRELYGASSGATWRADDAGVRRMSLIDMAPGGGPAASLIEAPAQARLDFAPAASGEYHVVVQGEFVVDGTSYKPYSMRYHIGAANPQSLMTGPDGATILVLTFDPTLPVDA